MKKLESKNALTALKKNFNKILICFLVAIFSAMTLAAQTDSTVYKKIGTEKTWNESEWEKAKDGIKYVNKDKPEKEEEFDLPNVDFEPPSFDWINKPLTKVIVVVILIALLAFTLYKLFAGSSDKKVKDVKNLGYSLEYLEDNIEESDFDRFLRMALENNDYRSGVRILFLRSLQGLHLKELIRWKKDKTNNDFLNEMRPHSSYKQFRNLTLAFEIVWYGDTAITEEQFTFIQREFNSFDVLINENKTSSNGK